MTRMSEAAGGVGGSSVTVEDDDNESATRTSSDQVILVCCYSNKGMYFITDLLHQIFWENIFYLRLTTT